MTIETGTMTNHTLIRRLRGLTRRIVWLGSQFPRISRSLRRLAWSERMLTLRLFMTLLFVECLIRPLPLHRLASIMGVQVDTTSVIISEPSQRQLLVLDDKDIDPRLVAIRIALGRVMRFWPFGGGPCLRESLVMAHVAKGHGAHVRIGVARRNERIAAHAWVAIADGALTDPRGYRAFAANQDPAT